jgi:hypothetical protein
VQQYAQLCELCVSFASHSSSFLGTAVPVIDVADGHIPDQRLSASGGQHIIKSEHCAATANNGPKAVFGGVMGKPPLSVGLTKTPR